MTLGKLSKEHALDKVILSESYYVTAGVDSVGGGEDCSDPAWGGEVGGGGCDKG